MGKPSIPMPPASVKSLHEVNTYFLRVSDFLNHPGNYQDTSADELLGQFVDWNKLLEQRLVGAGKQLIKRADKKAAPAAMSAILLFTKKYLAHEERLSAILQKESIDGKALTAEFAAQFEDITPFLSTVEGMDAGLLAKLKTTVKNAQKQTAPALLENAQKILGHLKETARTVPAIKEGLLSFVAASENFLSATKKQSVLKNDEGGIAVDAIKIPVYWIVLTFILDFLYGLVYNFAISSYRSGNVGVYTFLRSVMPQFPGLTMGNVEAVRIMRMCMILAAFLSILIIYLERRYEANILTLLYRKVTKKKR